MPADSIADSDRIVHEPLQSFVTSTNVWQFIQTYDIDDYDELIRRTTTEVDGIPESGVEWFWDELVDYLDVEFYGEYDVVRDHSNGPQFDDWYAGGKLNIAHNVVDRYAGPDTETRNKIATIWEGENGEVREITYHELYRQSNKVANYLDKHDIEPGDTVGLYMPMVPEIVSILYGCFKAGAIAVPIFSGFGTDATATRLDDSECSILFTGDGFLRRGSEITLKGAADDAIEQTTNGVERVVVFD
jgi:acetyl-CoA synthetase